MNQPASFIYRNIVFDGSGEAWGVYRLTTESYSGLTESSKLEVFGRLAALGYGIQTDFTLLRVSRQWSVDHYVMGVEAGCDVREARYHELGQMLDGHRDRLADRAAHVPEVYISLRLPMPHGTSLDTLRARPLQSLRRMLGMDNAVALNGSRLNEVAKEEEKAFQRVIDYIDADRAATHELQWLIRRAFSRGVGEPELDERFLPQALIVEAPEDATGVRYEPLEADVLRLFDSPVNVQARSLRIESERGDSHQALLCVGALPEELPFPSPRAELLFAPLENVDFPVDAAFSARWVDNQDALRLVRRRLLDADQMYREESYGDHGPTADSAQRPITVRELERYLSNGDRPPLLRASISLCVSAPDEETLEERVERLRREYGVVSLHRPLGEQLNLFVGHFPGQGSAVTDYDDYLTVEQFGAMVPTATSAAGAESGPYVGYTLNGARNPVLFDPTEASRTSRAPATLLSGTLGSGKTLCMELIMYQAFLSGSTICDIDPKGDHALERLPGVAEHMEVIELSPDERYRGLLDPLRIAPPETREDLAVDFLLGVLPEPVPAEWQTEIRLAVGTVCANGGHSCTQVIAELANGGKGASDAARALRVHSSSGLARLAFADQQQEQAIAGRKPITSLRIKNLTLPMPGTPRNELLEEERIGRAILHLLAVYALQLTTSDPGRHSVLGFDEAWVLLADGAGRALVDRISRLGRAQNVTPLLATQVLGDVEELDGLIGAAFCFGVETDAEARKALQLLHLDDDDASLRQRLRSFRRGRCMLRDYQGHVAPVQIDLVDARMLDALDTSPNRRPEPGPEPVRPRKLEVIHSASDD